MVIEQVGTKPGTDLFCSVVSRLNELDHSKQENPPVQTTSKATESTPPTTKQNKTKQKDYHHHKNENK